MNGIQHDDLLPGYEKNLTSDKAPNPVFMRFLDGDNDDYKNYQALCRGDPMRVRSFTPSLHPSSHLLTSLSLFEFFPLNLRMNLSS